MADEMFSFGLGSLRIHETALDQELHGRTGGVYRWLKRKGVEMTVAAKADAGFETGRLKKSIYHDIERVPLGLKLTVGARAPHALVHHEGARPHAIVIKKTKSRKPRTVLHPGSKANPFLARQLKFIRTP